MFHFRSHHKEKFDGRKRNSRSVCQALPKEIIFKNFVVLDENKKLLTLAKNIFS